MTDIEQRLRAVMHAAVDDEDPPGDLIPVIMRRYRRRRSALIAVAAVLVAVAIAVPTAIASRGRVPAPPASHHFTSQPTRLPTKMSGLDLPSAGNLQLLIPTFNGAAWYSTATRSTRAIVGLPDSQAGYGFERVDGGWAASGYSTNVACPSRSHYESNCAGPPQQYYFVGDGSLRATRIGAGWSKVGVAASSRVGAVWLISYPRPTDDTGNASADAQLVGTAGQPLGPRYRLPPASWPARGVGNYLLLFRDTGPLSLWDPRTGQVVRRIANVLDASPEQIAWSAGCRACRVRILNVSTGMSLTTPIPGNHPASLNGTLSDDGRLLAVRLPSGALAVFGTGNETLTVIPGTALSKAEWQHFDWQNGGHRLVVTAGPRSNPGPIQVAYWQPGDARLRVATVRNPHEFEALQTGAVG